MKKFGRLLGFRRDRDRSQWENPRTSIGEWRGVVREGRYTCWEAVGPVRETWARLGPEIKDYIETSCKYGPALSLEIYMIGRSEATAAPKILICSTDVTARKEVRRAIMGSGIMNNYPPIGLGDTAKLPDLLAQEDIEASFLTTSKLSNETVVLSPTWDKPFGRRLFIPRRDGSPLRPATAAPILHINGKIYQLTVGHAFSELDDGASNEARSSSLDDCDFDGQDDSDGDSSADLDMAVKANLKFKDGHFHSNFGPTGIEMGTISQDSSSQNPESSSATARQSLGSAAVDLSAQNISTGNNKPQTKEPVIARRLDRVGKLALVSETGTKQSLDYALVELEGIYRHGSNEVTFGPNGSQRWLRVRKVAKIGPGDVSIATMTASLGFMSGKLSATASFMRLHNQRTLQELYSVRLDGKLVDGDCGSGVIDRSTGDLYGHIVAGSLGTGFAYIVPAMHVFEDISDRLGGDVTLIPLEKPTRTGLEPLRLVEFASERYFSELKQPTQSNKDENNYKKSASIRPIPAASFISSSSRQLSHRQCERALNSVLWLPQQQNSPKGRKILEPINNFGSKSSALRSRAENFNVEGKGKGKAEGGAGFRTRFVPHVRNRRESTPVSSSVAFEERFFTLPSDLRVQIIASLHVSDILNLRMASRNWHNLISLNEAPISRTFLQYNPVPPFATCLYPIPNPSEINLHYICGLWHRLLVVSKLSTVMTEWVTRDYFLRKTEAQRLEFLPQQDRMRFRLVPLLFTIFHFFEMYRHLHLKRRLDPLRGEAYTINRIELQIMKMYDNETLLQVHQIFPLLVSFLNRRLKPPSYLGHLERSLRGYVQDPPPDHVQVAILCVGGLTEVARFSDIKAYDERRKAVDSWYTSVAPSPSPINSESQSHGWLMRLRRKHSRQASFNPADSSTDNAASTSCSISSLSSPGDSPDGCRRSSHRGSILFNTSLAAGPPMSPLPAAHTRLLLPDLPLLENIWLLTAEALLLKRHVVERRQDIKRNAQVMHELTQEGITDADELFYGPAANDIIREDGPLA